MPHRREPNSIIPASAKSAEGVKITKSAFLLFRISSVVSLERESTT